MPMRRIERYFQSKIIGPLLKNLSRFTRNSGRCPGLVDIDNKTFLI